MGYESLTLKKLISIHKIYTVHYFEYMKDFVFDGESHDFWEFACVDKGEVNILTDEGEFPLQKDEIRFHKPNEFHGVKSNGRIAPNLVVVSFECSSPAMNYFSGRTLRIGEKERELLAQIIAEARKAFQTPLDDPYLCKIKRAASQPSGSEQLISLYLEELLIRLIRNGEESEDKRRNYNVTKQKNNDEAYLRIFNYLESHLEVPLSIEQICHDNLIGRAALQKLFRARHSCGVMEYFSRMKIDRAKQLIRTRDLNFTQIADLLGYGSIHYFSRHFKTMTGMTPSEYSASIKKLAEKY